MKRTSSEKDVPMSYTTIKLQLYQPANDQLSHILSVWVRRRETLCLIIIGMAIIQDHVEQLGHYFPMDACSRSQHHVHAFVCCDLRRFPCCDAERERCTLFYIIKYMESICASISSSHTHAHTHAHSRLNWSQEVFTSLLSLYGFSISFTTVDVSEKAI